MRHVFYLVSLSVLFLSCFSFDSNDNYYTILGVSRSATSKEIKKAYHKRSLEYHPDRNKSPNARDKFSTVAEAYEVLKDDEKRQIYDRHGKDGLKQQERGDFGTDPFEQFEDMFGGSFGGFGGGRRKGGRQQRKKGPELNTKIRLTLEELYVGKEIPFLISKTLICDHCRGSGKIFVFLEKKFLKFFLYKFFRF